MSQYNVIPHRGLDDNNRSVEVIDVAKSKPSV